jgi:O-antigen ligase
LVVAAISSIKNINFSEALFEWLKLFLSVAFLSVCCIVIGNDKDRIQNLAKAFVILGTLIAAMGICQYYRLAFVSIPGNYVIFATLAHKNLLASALFLILPFVLYATVAFCGVWRLISLIAVIFMSFCIILSRARTVWLAIICAALFVTITWLAQNRKTVFKRYRQRLNYKKYLWLVSSILIFISAAMWVSHHSINRIFTMADNNEISAAQVYPLTKPISSPATIYERIWLWQNSWKMVQENPMRGVGMGQWRIRFPDYTRVRKMITSDEGIEEIVFQRPHNDYLWVLAELGIAGLLAYLAILIIPICYCFKMLFKASDRNLKFLAGCLLFGLIGYMIISFFSFPKERIVHNIFLMLIIACVVCCYHSSFPKRSSTRYAKIGVLSMIAMLLLVLCIFTGHVRMQSEIHTRKARLAFEQENWQAVVAEIDKANTVFYQIDPVSTPVHWYRGVANFSMGRYKDALGDFTKAYQAHPYHYHVLNNVGSSYAKVGDYGKAAVFFHKALDELPGFQDALVNLGIVYYHLGDLPKAHRYLSLSKSIEGDIRPFVYLNLIEN